jgi:uncharacterized protein YtpQ (UPF0354 family)
LDSLPHRFPAVKFTIKDDSTFVGEYQGNEIQQMIDNAYIEYKSAPDSLGSILHRYVMAAAEVYSSHGTLTKDNIIPVIKSVGYISSLQNVGASLGANKGFNAVFEKYNDQLMIVYAQDTKAGINYFPAEDLTKSGIAKDSLRVLAIKNLISLLPDIKVRAGDGLYMVTAGGNYEASLLLLDYLWTKKNMEVDGDFIAGVPTRDLLLVTGSNDKSGILKLKGLVKKMYATGDYTISDQIYRRVGDKFVKYE